MCELLALHVWSLTTVKQLLRSPCPYLSRPGLGRRSVPSCPCILPPLCMELPGARARARARVRVRVRVRFRIRAVAKPRASVSVRLWLG